MAFEIPDCKVIYYKRRQGDVTAVLVASPFFPDGEEWLPWSAIHDDSVVYREGDEGTLIIQDWWAEKKGWI